MKRIYVAATQQHDGKTTVSLGLYHAARQRGLKPCFIKPIGQRYVMDRGERVDEDAVLFKYALDADGDAKSLSPITIPRGFTHDYIFHRDPESIRGPILAAVGQLAEGHDVMVIEGTGHAGVGAVIDASNAEVAAMLDARAIIISSGGIGRCIDELVLNQALFDRCKVPVIGAIVNKVYPEKYDKISASVRQGLANRGMECLGVVPYQGELTYPDMSLIQERFGLEVLCGGKCMRNIIKDIIVAAMSPQNMLSFLTEDGLVIVPGDRVDNIIASVMTHVVTGDPDVPSIAGLVLTGGFVPHVSVVNILNKVDVPVLLSTEDTASIAVKISNLVPKLGPGDTNKIALAERMICDHVDVERVFAAVGV